MSKLAAAAYVGGLVWFGLVLADVLARELASWLPGSAARADVEDQGAAAELRADCAHCRNLTAAARSSSPPAL